MSTPTSPITVERGESMIEMALSNLNEAKRKVVQAIASSLMPESAKHYLNLQLNEFLSEVKKLANPNCFEKESDALQILADAKCQLESWRRGAHLKATEYFLNFYRSLEPGDQETSAEDLARSLDKSPSYATAKVNFYSFNPLHIICRHNRSSLLYPLLQQHVNLCQRSGAPYYATPLLLAIESGAISSVKSLLNLSKNETYHQLGSLAQVNTPDGTRLANTPLIKAVCLEATYADNYAAPKLNDFTMHGALIKALADVNQTNALGRTALHYAMLYQDFELACYLIDKGADLFIKDVNGLAPFHLSLLNDREVAKELTRHQISFDHEHKKITTYERHKSLFLDCLGSEKMSSEQKESMTLLMRLSDKLDNVYFSHCMSGGKISEQKFSELRGRLFSFFTDFSERIKMSKLKEFFREFIADTLSDVDYKIALDEIDLIFKETSVSLFQVEPKKRTVAEKLEFLRRAYRNDAICNRDLATWLKLFPKEVSKIERLQWLFLPIHQESDDTWLQQAYLRIEGKLQLEEQILFTEKLCEALRKNGLIAEWISLQCFMEILKGLKPLNKKINALSGDRSSLAKRKVEVLTTYYSQALESGFNLFKESRFAKAPGSSECCNFANELASRKETLLLINGSMLDTRRNHFFDGFLAFLSMLKGLLLRLVGRGNKKEKRYLGSRQAIEITQNNLKEKSDNFKAWSNFLEERSTETIELVSAEEDILQLWQEKKQQEKSLSSSVSYLHHQLLPSSTAEEPIESIGLIRRNSF